MTIETTSAGAEINIGEKEVENLSKIKGITKNIAEESNNKSNDKLDDRLNNVSNDNWHAGLSDEFRDNKSLEKFKDLNGLVKSYLNLEKSFNNKIEIPGIDASIEDRGKFYDRLGRPTDKKYWKENRDTGHEEIVSGYEELFYNQGLSEEQGREIIARMYKLEKENTDNFNLAMEAEYKKNVKLLEEKYGDKFNVNIAQARLAIDKYGNKNLGEIIEKANYHPEIIDFLVKVGESLSPKSLITSGINDNNILSSDQALKEIKKLESDVTFMLQYKDRKQAGHSEAVKRMNELYGSAYGK
jgi:hypothetical protein